MITFYSSSGNYAKAERTDAGDRTHVAVRWKKPPTAQDIEEFGRWWEVQNTDDRVVFSERFDSKNKAMQRGKMWLARKDN